MKKNLTLAANCPIYNLYISLQPDVFDFSNVDYSWSAKLQRSMNCKGFYELQEVVELLSFATRSCKKYKNKAFNYQSYFEF